MKQKGTAVVQFTAESIQHGGRFHIASRSRWLRRARVGFSAMRALGSNVNDDIAGNVLTLALEAGPLSRHARRIAQTEEGRRFLAEKPTLRISAEDVEAFRKLPAGTLGNLLAQYYDDFGIKPFISNFPFARDEEYLARRYRELHDIVHVVTGYGADVPGELQLQAFTLGNLGFRTVWMGVAYLVLIRPEGSPSIWSEMSKLMTAYRRGRQSKDAALEPRYELHWHLPIEEVRRRFGIVDAPSPALS